MTQAIDRLDLSEFDAVQEYGGLARALRRKRGFGLFFVQASPAKGQEILADLRRDLPHKRIAEVALSRTDERLFDQLEAIWEQEKVDIFWIEGLEQSLLGYEDMQRLAGWDDLDLMTYSWKDVPPILSHLNLGRERFEARFDCVLVFVVPLFVVKYLLRRAGDFFDWKSGFFEFPDDPDELVQRVMKDADYGTYLKLNRSERTQKILQVKDLLDGAQITIDRRVKLLREVGLLFQSGEEYEQAIASYDCAIALKSDFGGAWFDRADALRQLGRYDEAITSYQMVIQLYPQDAYAYYNLANTYKDKKDYEQAIEAYQKVIRLAPIVWKLLSWKMFRILCKIWLRFRNRRLTKFTRLYIILRTLSSRAETYLLMKRYREALKDFNWAIELEPTAQKFSKRGETYQALERHNEALRDFDRAIDLKPTHWRFCDRGQFHQLMEHHEKALKDFDRAIELDGESYWALDSRAETYEILGRYEEALKDFDRAIEINNKYPWAIASRAGIYKSLERYEEALKDFDQVIELAPTNWNFWKRGETYRLMRRYDEALKDFDRSIDLNSDLKQSFASRGETYRLMTCYEEALKDFDQAIELDSEYGWAIASRGETYQSLERYEEALKNFNRAIELDSEWAWAIAQRGETYRLMECYDKALKDFDHAIELDNEYAWAIEKRGCIYLQLNQPERALAGFDLAIELNPDDWYFYFRAIAHLKLNQPEYAEAEFQKAIAIAQAAYEKDPTDYQNTFNLALYHLAAAHPEESDRLYTINLTAPIEWLQMAIDDLDDFLHLFPDHAQAQQVKQLLKGAIETTQPNAL
jgi:tetratricopeptide (TPR) repeat protein